MDSLDSLLSESPDYLIEATRVLTASIVRRLLGEYVSTFVEDEAVLGEILRAVSLAGATRGAANSLLMVDKRLPKPIVTQPPPFAGRPSPGVPGPALDFNMSLPAVRPTFAIRDILEREPRVLRTAQALSDLYGTEYVFGVSKAATEAITAEAQAAIAKVMTEGNTVLEASRIIADLDEGFSRSYAENVYRTNTASAYTNGMFSVVNDPAVRQVIGAFRYQATHDRDVRPNHLAYDNGNPLIASPDDPIWHVAAPPQGFNCRCALEMVPWEDIPKDRIDKRTGKVTRARLPSGAHPDPGFKPTGFNPGIAVALAR